MNENNEKINNRIKELRLTLGLTQEELALKLGLKGKSSIANYEKGKISPSDDVKLKMCNVFNCSLDYLMGKTNFKITDDFYRTLDYVIKDTFYEKYYTKLINLGLSNDDIKVVSNIYFITPKHEDLINDMDKVSSEQTIIFSNVLKKYSLEVQQELLKIIGEFLKSKEKVVRGIMKDVNEDKDKNNSNIPQYYMCPVYGKISAGQPNWAEECIEGRIPIDPELMNVVNPGECFFLRVDGESMNKEIKNGAYALIRKTDFVENGEIAVVLVNGFDATLKKFSKQGDLIILEPMSSDSSFTTQVYGKDTDIKVIGKYIGKMEMK